MDIKPLAEESDKTKKLREKLRKHLDKLDAQVTKEEIDKKISEINGWISRHAMSRVSLKHKSFSLFDENQNPANCSTKVLAVMEFVRKNFTPL